MKVAERLRAREMRLEGFSIKEICAQLSVSQSSVSVWVRDIHLTREQIDRLEQKMTTVRARFGYLSRCGGANTNKVDAEKRHREFERAGYERARTDERFRLVCALYWGEGAKSRRSGFQIANSDPKLLRIVLGWLVSNGYKDVLRFRVQYYAENGLSEEEIKHWWNEQLPQLQESSWTRLSRCVINRASQRKKIGRLVHGTATISVFRTELFFQIMGGIRYLQELGDW
jgi:hypothetical protein